MLCMQKADFILSLIDIPNFSVLVFKRLVILIKGPLYFKK